MFKLNLQDLYSFLFLNKTFVVKTVKNSTKEEAIIIKGPVKHNLCNI